MTERSNITFPAEHRGCTSRYILRFQRATNKPDEGLYEQLIIRNKLSAGGVCMVEQNNANPRYARDACYEVAYHDS